MAKNLTFIDGVTPIPADWLNNVNAIVNSSQISANSAMTAPSTGTHAVGDFVQNTNPVLLGPVGSQYIVDGWQCITAGTPGVWVELRLLAAPTSTNTSTGAGPTPVNASQGGPLTLYNQTVEGENMTGATALTASQISAIFLPNDFSGTGIADQDTTAGVTKTASFTGIAAGTYTINIRYFCWSNQDNNIQIDSGTSTNYVFPSGTGYQILSIPNVVLTAGSHAIKFISHSGFTYLDYVNLTQTSSSTSTGTSAPSAAPASSPILFGSRADGAYPYGIRPNGHTNANLDASVEQAYNNWKAARLKSAPSFVPANGVYAGQTITDARYVDFGDGTTATVSEGIGYGMLISVIMAGYDINAQAHFNALFKTARCFPAYSSPSPYGNTLMDWKVNLPMSPAGGGYNALDGDLDIAMALLMANRQWGSSGTINYYQEALNTIAAIKALNFSSTGVPWDSYHDVSRTSDYMTGHFRAFKKATNDTFWDNAVTNSLALANSVINASSATYKLPPGWIYQPMTNPQPSPGGKIEGPYEGYYDANAMRDALRWGTAYVWSGNTTEQTLAGNISNGIKTISSSNPDQTCWMYLLNGTPWTTPYYEPTQVASVMVGGMTNATYQTWVNTCWDKLSQNYNTNYYAAEISLLALIVASGNWWNP